MSKKILVDLDFGSSTRAVNVPTPTASGDMVNKGYVDANIEGIAWKDSVRVSTVASNINLASPGATIDAITMVSGDRVLVQAQTSVLENGIYVWNGTASAMTRSADCSTFDELEGAVVTVEQGTNAGATFRQTQVNGVIGTNDIVWTSFGTSSPAASETVSGIAELATQSEADTGTDDLRIITPLKMANWSGRKRKFSADFGDGAATTYNISHNFASRDCHVSVYRASTPWDDIMCDVERSDTNTVNLKFAVAPTSNQFRVVVLG